MEEVRELPPHLQRIEDETNRIGESIIDLLNREKAPPVVGMLALVTALLNGLQSAPEPLPSHLEELRRAALDALGALGELIDKYHRLPPSAPGIN